MPQALLPLIPDGATPLNDRISVTRQDGQWTYFCGIAPVFQHGEDDRKSFRMFTAQLCCQGACTQAEIIRTFGVSKNSVLRSVEKYRREGNAGFFQPRRGRCEKPGAKVPMRLGWRPVRKLARVGEQLG
jgi:hypothetical protein